MKDSPKKNKKVHVKKASKQTGKKTHDTTQTLLYLLPLLSLLIILLVLTVYNLALKQQIAANRIYTSKSVTFSQYPLVMQNFSPDITAEAAIIVDDTSKVVIYEKKPLLRFSMASTTKVMTALIALEHFNRQDVITVYTPNIEGAAVGFPQGERIYFEDMLYGMLLPSGNDAAYAIAENYPGGVESFVTSMNEKAHELQLYNTSYADPTGLDDDGNYTTVTDLARLASYALQNQEISLITQTKQKTITNVDGSNTYQLTNLNKLLGENGVTGLKTGFTEGAGEVLVTSKIEKGRTFIIVVMRSKDRFLDTQKLLSLISNNVSFINPVEYLKQQ